MRTNKEYIMKFGELTDMVFYEKYRNKPTLSVAEVDVMLFEARKEAIKECAKRVTLESYYRNSKGEKYNKLELGEEICDMELEDCYYSVDKQSILNLINELK